MAAKKFKMATKGPKCRNILLNFEFKVVIFTGLFICTCLQS